MLSLPAISPTNSPRPAAVSSQALSEWKTAASEEAKTRKRIAKLKRELARKRQLQSLSDAQRTRYINAEALRDQVNEAKGAKVAADVAHVEPASDEEVRALSELFNTQLLPSTPTTPRITWYTLFKHVDNNNSGRIGFDEFVAIIRPDACNLRRCLSLKPDQLSDDRIRSLWRVLDEDGDGTISAGEFGHFMRKGQAAAAESARARLFAARLAAQRRQNAEADAYAGRDLSAQLRASEEELSDAELHNLSELFNRCLAKVTAPDAVESWFRLFKIVDYNRSGRIDFVESVTAAPHASRTPATPLIKCPRAGSCARGTHSRSSRQAHACWLALPLVLVQSWGPNRRWACTQVRDGRTRAAACRARRPKRRQAARAVEGS